MIFCKLYTWVRVWASVCYYLLHRKSLSQRWWQTAVVFYVIFAASADRIKKLCLIILAIYWKTAVLALVSNKCVAFEILNKTPKSSNSLLIYIRMYIYKNHKTTCGFLHPSVCALCVEVSPLLSAKITSLPVLLTPNRSLTVAVSWGNLVYAFLYMPGH